MQDFVAKIVITKSIKALTIDSIMSHLKGNEVIGVYPLYKDNTCRFLVFDFDNHDKDAGNDFCEYR